MRVAASFLSPIPDIGDRSNLPERRTRDWTDCKKPIGSFSRSADQPRRQIYIEAGVQWIKARGVTTHSSAVEYLACVEFRGLSVPRGSDTRGSFRALDPAGLTILWGWCGHGQQILCTGPLAQVQDDILATRATMRAAHGWIMDIYLIHKT